MQPRAPLPQVDALAPEDGVFSPAAPLGYHLAIRRLLLPDPGRALQLVVLPAFAPEYAVYVLGRDRPGGPRRAPPERTLVTGRLVTQLWGAAAEGCTTAPDARGVRAQHGPSDEVFATLSPEVDWARAPLGEDAYQRLRATWDAALDDVRGGATVLGMDGVGYRFAAGSRAGATWSPPAGSIRSDLVALGDALVDLARLGSEAERPARERAVADQAAALLARIRAGAGPRGDPGPR
jgi:hypothetical protein